MGKQSWMVTSSEAIKTPHLVQRLVRINQLNFPSKSCQLEDTYTDLGAAWKKGEKDMEKLVFTLIRMQKKWIRCSVPHKDLLHVIWCHLAFLKGSMYKIYCHRYDPLIGSNWGHLSLAAMLKTIKKKKFIWGKNSNGHFRLHKSSAWHDNHWFPQQWISIFQCPLSQCNNTQTQWFPTFSLHAPPFNRRNASLLLHMHKGNIRMSLGELFIHKKLFSPNSLFFVSMHTQNNCKGIKIEKLKERLTLQNKNVFNTSTTNNNNNLQWGTLHTAFLRTHWAR